MTKKKNNGKQKKQKCVIFRAENVNPNLSEYDKTKMNKSTKTRTNINKRLTNVQITREKKWEKNLSPKEIRFVGIWVQFFFVRNLIWKPFVCVNLNKNKNILI